MIEVTSLFAGYDKADVLKNVSFTCKPGQVSTLIGPNGCGKSTLLKAITGMLPVSRGDIKIDGVSLQSLGDKQRAQKISYLSQGKNIPEISVERMVLHGRFPYLSYPRKYRECDYAAARKAMEKMGIAHLGGEPVSRLSGGMRQKVYIAMALCQGADIILLDEPATYLDVSQQLKLSETCRELAEDGKTVLCVSHDIISALKNSEQIIVMQEGRIEKIGTPDEIIKSGIIPKVFSVDVRSVQTDMGREYYYKSCDNAQTTSAD